MAKDGSKRRAKDGEGEKSSKKKAKTGSTTSSADAVLQVRQGDAPLGTVLASFSDFVPPKTTAFSLYRASGDGHESDTTSTTPKIDDRLLVAGSTPTVQYLSSNWGWGASSQAKSDIRRETRGYSGEYMLGVYNKDTKQVTLRAVPVFTLNRTVKALAETNAMAIERGTEPGFDYTRARRDLGDTFGNKKQKQAARNMDRMKVNTQNMDGVLEHVASGIGESMVNMPSEAELAMALNASRALPQANLAAEDPADVYALDTVFPPAVRKVLGTRPLLASESQAALGEAMRSLSLPSPWLLPRVWNAVQTAQNDEHGASKATEQVRLGYYLALLLAFRRHARGLSRGDDHGSAVAQKMRLHDHEKEVVMDDLLTRFTEKKRGSSKYVCHAHQTCHDRHHRDEVVWTHLGARTALGRVQCRPRACRARAGRVDAEVRVNCSPRVSEMFRSLGCTTAQATQHGVEEGVVVTQQVKRWRLKLPLAFPQQRKRGPPRR